MEGTVLEADKRGGHDYVSVSDCCSLEANVKDTDSLASESIVNRAEVHDCCHLAQLFYSRCVWSTCA